ncbi:MAG TPA: hypothetical protein VGP43_03000 [Chitinophagaceae bacterium]|nr:hypothetical protein [Chitinophagaceae bacterium]
MKIFSVFIFAAIALASFTGCDRKESYVDLETGQTITLEKDSTTGYMVNAETKKPVGIYVNTATHDTIFGRSGKVINNFVVKHPDGRYTYQADGDIKVIDGDAKLKVDGDGDTKVKEGDYKKKVQSDGDVKIKDGDTKIKIDKDGDRKVKSK